MPHYKFEPRKELEYLSERMKKFVEDFPEAFSVEFGKEYTPRVEIVQNETNVFVHIELPGVDRSGIALKIKDNMLIVSGDKNLATDENNTITMSERAYGPFNREILLPEKVDRDKIQAKFDAGVLTVTLVKIVPDSAKEINIDIE